MLAHVGLFRNRRFCLVTNGTPPNRIMILNVVVLIVNVDVILVQFPQPF